MLTEEQVSELKATFLELYKTKTPMELLNILREVNDYLHEESAIVRRLAFTEKNWEFRAMLKLRREAIQNEIRRR